MTERNDRLVWVDVETTGLDPRQELLLEVACVITDSNLEEIASGHWVLYYPDAGINAVRLNIDPAVNAMHEKSGLWEEIPSGRGLLDVEEGLADLLDDARADGSRLAGSSVHFDRAWLTEYLPSIESRLHYRNLDVSSVAYVVDGWVGCGTFPKAKGHRALADIRESIAELRWLRGVCRV